MNLPASAKWTPPAYQGITKRDILLLTSPGAGAIIRVIAGEVDGHVGPGSTHTPITILHASIPAGERLSLPWQPDFNAMAYVFAGSGTAGIEAAPIHGGNMVVFGNGDRVTLAADATQDSRTDALEVMLLGGKPIREPAFQYGPFVMNTEAELAQAIDDYQHGRMGVIPPGALQPHVYRG